MTKKQRNGPISQVGCPPSREGTAACPFRPAGHVGTALHATGEETALTDEDPKVEGAQGCPAG